MAFDPKDGRERRRELLRKIGQIRGSSVIGYICSDRQHPFAFAAISADIIRPMYDHLLALGNLSSEKGKLDLFIYSRGGDVSVPWTLVSMVRECYQHFNVLIPFRAHSAATMIAIGADNIIMGRKGELGPIDPTLSRQSQVGAPPAEIPVEDVSSYLNFIKERAGITDQSALAQCTTSLAEQLQPLTLGSVNRMYSHIRSVAKKLLTARADKKLDEERIRVITEVLTEKIYYHGHSISRREAQELGLAVAEDVSGELETLMWALFEEYERFLQLREPIDPMYLLDQGKAEELSLKDVAIGCIESDQGLHLFQHDITFARQRRIPPNPNININLNLQMPQPAGLPAGAPMPMPALPQQVVDQLMQQIQQTVRQQIIQQSEVVGLQVRMANGSWREIELTKSGGAGDGKS
ncbi:MAG TPA: hypothetical protein VGK89_11580 [Candidatus Eisenbacteria bacterium]|jgi:hypothetical protein